MRNDHRDPRENAPINNSLTEAERKRLVELHFETAEFRQAESALNLLKAVQLGEALRKPKGG